MITYNDILSQMQDKFTELSGYSADDASDIGIRLKVLAGEIYSSYTNMEFIKTQMFPQTATDKYLDMHAQQRGLERIGATKSKGSLTFSRPSYLSYDVTIPEGTVCSTSGVNSVRFVTLEDATIEAGETSVTVLSESESAGAETNTSANTITVMVTPPAGVKSVNNASAFVGGSDSESDDELRVRLLDSYKDISNGTNCAFYKQCALGYDDVYSASVIGRPSDVAGTVDIYVAGKGVLLTSSVINAIQSDINSLREVNVDVSVKSPTAVNINVSATITISDGYDADTVKANCKANLENYFSTLHIGEDVLLCNLGNVIYNTDGIENYSFVSPSDTAISSTHLAMLNNVSLTVDGGGE